MAKGTKINITNSFERSEEVEITEGRRPEKQEKEKIDGQIQKVYLEETSCLEKPNFISAKIIWLTIIFSLFFGLIAGAIGGFFILTSEKIKIPFLKEIELKKYFPTREITLTTEKKITVTQDTRVAEMSQDLKLQIAKIFLAKKTKEESLPILEQIYSPLEVLGTGFILTNDGWMVFAKKNLLDLQKEYVVMIENKIFPVEKILSDPSTEVVFIKAKATNLAAAKLANQDELSTGQQVLIFGHDDSLTLNRISYLRYREIKKNEDLIRSTDQFNDFILLENELPEKFLGSPVFNFDKSVVGIVVNKTIIRPIFQIYNIIPLVLENKKIIRPYLGLNYLNLFEAIGIADPRFKDFNYGAIVWGSPVKNSPAAKANLENGDLILKVDGLPINDRHNLTDLIQEHKPGDAIEIIFVRNGIEKSVKVILDSK